jgi:hypothetical protein
MVICDILVAQDLSKCMLILVLSAAGRTLQHSLFYCDAIIMGYDA